jgi:hypothetical protein
MNLLFTCWFADELTVVLLFDFLELLPLLLFFDSLPLAILNEVGGFWEAAKQTRAVG